jgi:hypothetical protein
MTKRIYIVLLITILTAGFTFVLVSKSQEPFKNKHGFNRIFNNNRPLKLLRHIPLPDARYIAGMDSTHIYFHSSQPALITYTDTALHNLQTISLPVDSAVGRLLMNGFSTHVRYPDIFIYGYNIAAILRYNVPLKRLTVIRAPGNYTNGVQVSDSIFILKYFTGEGMEQSFCRLNIFSMQYNTDSTIAKEDLSSSGVLLYDETQQHCLYVHHYNNNIRIFDTALHAMTSARTIDTFTTSQVAFTARNRTGSTDMVYKPKGSRMLINSLSHIHQGVLYVNSLMKADNESDRTAQQETVIDMYDSGTGRYMQSFYLPLIGGQGLRSFRVYGKRVLTTYANGIALFELP